MILFLDVEGSGSALCSAKDLAEEKERILRLLNGEVLDNLVQPTSRLTVAEADLNSSSRNDEVYGIEDMAVGGLASPSTSRDRQRSPDLPTAAIQGSTPIPHMY